MEESCGEVWVPHSSGVRAVCVCVVGVWLVPREQGLVGPPSSFSQGEGTGRHLLLLHQQGTPAGALWDAGGC